MVEMEVRKVTKGVESNMVAFDFERTPITQIADYIIITASNNGTSDIHFDPREDGMMVRMRIDGDLQDYTYIPKLYERNLTTRLKLLANMNITESRLPQDGAIKGEFGGKYLDMRVSCLPLNTGEKIVIRILDYSRSLQGIDNLGFNQTNLKKIKRMMGVPNGIILITGATGSGKSTTVYSILQGLNKPEINIITVEDPIEMNIEGMNQVQVNAEIGMTFAAALRSILRQDPNVILIGEIRDSETAQIAVRASITGHLVLSTIHTNNSLATIERLLDMDVERYLMSTALTGIVSQRLGKQLCMDCRVERETTKYEKKVFKKFMKLEVDKIYDANHKGCDNCRNGYKGRIAIHEVLELDDNIRNAINNPKLKKEELADMVYGGGTISMLQDALGKALSGLTSFEEVYRVIEMESDDEDDVSYLTRSLDDDEEEVTDEVELATDSLDEDAPKSNNKIGAIVEPGKDDKIVKFDPTKQGSTKVKKDGKDVKDLVKEQTDKSKDPTTPDEKDNKTTQPTTPAPTTPGTLPQVATLTPEQAKAQADAEAMKKAQEAAGNKKEPTAAPTMLNAEQAKAQADAAKDKYEQQKAEENEKKILDFLSKPDPNAVKKNKLVIAKPNITPTAVTELPNSKQKPQQVLPSAPQQAQHPDKPQVLVKQAPPTVPQPEKIEKEIPELNISIKTNEDNAHNPLINDSPIINEEEKTFEEKDKVAEIDISKISKATDLEKNKQINDNQLIPTISADKKHGGSIPIIIDSFDTDADLSKVSKSNGIKKEKIRFKENPSTENSTTPEITNVIDEPLIINTKEIQQKDLAKKDEKIASTNNNLTVTPQVSDIKTDIKPTTDVKVTQDKVKDTTPVIKPELKPTVDVKVAEDKVKDTTPVIKPEIKPTVDVKATEDKPKETTPVIKPDVKPIIDAKVTEDKPKETTPVIKPDVKPIIDAKITEDKPKETTPVIKPELKPTVDVKVTEDKPKETTPVIKPDVKPIIDVKVTEDKPKETTPVIKPDVKPIIDAKVTEDKPKETTPVIKPDVKPTIDVKVTGDKIKETTPVIKPELKPTVDAKVTEDKPKETTPVIKPEIKPTVDVKATEDKTKLDNDEKAKEKFKILVKPDGTKVLVKPVGTKTNSDSKEKFKVLVKPDGTKVLVKPVGTKTPPDEKEKLKILVKPDGTKVLVKPTTPKTEVSPAAATAKIEEKQKTEAKPETKEITKDFENKTPGEQKDKKIETKTQEKPSKDIETKVQEKEKNIKENKVTETKVEPKATDTVKDEVKPKRKEIKVVPTAVKKANPTKKVDIEKRPEAEALKKTEKKEAKTLVKPVGITKAKTAPKKKTTELPKKETEEKQDNIKKENKEVKTFKMPEIIHEKTPKEKNSEENNNEKERKKEKTDTQLKTFELPKISAKEEPKKETKEEVKAEKKPFITEMKSNAFDFPKVTNTKTALEQPNETKAEKKPFITEMKSNAFNLPKVTQNENKVDIKEDTKEKDVAENNKEEPTTTTPSKTITKPSINIFDEPIDTTKMKKPRTPIQEEKKEETTDLDIDLDLDIDGELLALGED